MKHKEEWQDGEVKNKIKETMEEVKDSKEENKDILDNNDGWQFDNDDFCDSFWFPLIGFVFLFFIQPVSWTAESISCNVCLCAHVFVLAISARWQ